MNKYYLSGIAAGAALVGGLYLYRNRKERQIDEIPDTILIQFLKELKSQSFPHFFLVAGIVKGLEMDTQNEDEFDLLFNQIKPEIESLFEAKQKLVMGKYSYNLQQIQDALSRSTNKRVIDIQQKYEYLYTNSIIGVAPEIELKPQTISQFNQDEIVQILQEVLNSSMTTIYKICKHLKDLNGPDYEISLQKPNFVLLLHEYGFTQSKRKILMSHNIIQFEDTHDDLGEPQSPTEVFSKITQYKKNQDDGFKQRIDAVEKKYEVLIGKFMKESIAEDKAKILIDEAQQ